MHHKTSNILNTMTFINFSPVHTFTDSMSAYLLMFIQGVTEMPVQN